MILRRGQRIPRSLRAVLLGGLFLFSRWGTGAALADSPANPFDDTIRILERWTSSHWGRDCFVWVLHYPGELVEPWVEAEALRSGMTEAEKRAYRDTFVSELKIGSAETFLLSVYSFGPKPVSLSPVSDNVALVTSSGARLRPTRYDSHLDSPSGGVVQGLVFFPKQTDRNFALAVKGMGIHDERIFAFGAPNAAAVAMAPQKEEPEVVVVDLPRRRPVRSANGPSAPQQAPQVIESPPPPPPMQPRPIPPLLEENSRDMAAFIDSVRDRGAPPGGSGVPPKNAAGPGAEAGARPDAGVEAENAYKSREQILRHFLDLWAANQPEEMYAMLSDSSRKIISRDNFSKEVAKAADFRAGLRDGYRIDWVGEERARVITDRRLLMFRSLVTRTLGVVRERSDWKIVW